MMTELEALRDAIGRLDGVQTCRIGLEPNISPADYPLVRLSPLRAVPGRPYHGRTVECMAYFGARVTDAEGMEHVYASLLALEAQILAALRAAGCSYVETIIEPGAFQPISETAYKISGIRFKLPAANQAPA